MYLDRTVHMPNNAINADAQKHRFALLLHAGMASVGRHEIKMTVKSGRSPSHHSRPTR